MKNLNLFLYICLVRFKAINLILKKFEKFKISVILDMEDSAQDLFDSQNNLKLKKISREGLKYLSDNKILKNTNTFVRINSQNSEFYDQDINTISNVLKNKTPLVGIFLPKVESYDQIEDCYSKVSSLAIKPISIVPMIETKKGLENLNDLLLKDKKRKIIKYVHYGHYDYCLDNKLWPFPEPYHLEYWQIIEKVSKNIVKHNKKYIHTPFPLIETENIYWSSINYMKNLDIDEINLSLVNIDINYINKPNNIKQTKLKNITKDMYYKKIFAKKIIKEYLDNKSKNKSFSLSRKRFIPPHLYLGAKEFLSKG